jgi:hypothetical protein
MPMTFDGSGTITGLAAGGLPNSSVITADIADAAITAAKLDGAQSGSAPIYGARAWVNFDGTGTVAIRASGNVSSITDNGTGNYTVNFTTAMTDANYNFVATTDGDGTNGGVCFKDNTVSPTTTTCRFRTKLLVGVDQDRAEVCVSIFR